MTSLMATIAYCIVGCNTGSPDGEALHLLRCDAASGEVRIVQTVRGVSGTTYFQFAPDGSCFYTIVADATERVPPVADATERVPPVANAPRQSSAVRFALERDAAGVPRIGAMTRLAALPSEAPCHVALSPDATRLTFAAYSSATVSSLTLGARDAVSRVLPDIGVGPRADRQKKAYAHCTFYLPDAQTLGVVDLGCDRIHLCDPATLKEVAPPILSAAGDGPRHAILSRDKRFLFVVNELSSSVTSYAFTGPRSVRALGTWPMLPAGTDPKSSKAAAIKLTADGKVLFASNRGADTIAIFDVKDDGSLAFRNAAKLKGAFPRDFELMPGEQFMLVGHKMSNEIQVYAYDRARATLTAVGKPLAVWRPLCFKFIASK